MLLILEVWYAFEANERHDVMLVLLDLKLPAHGIRLESITIIHPLRMNGLIIRVLMHVT